MKKAQILGALALAFALGVAVIPTASTYAATFVQDGKVVDNLNEKIENAIAKAKDDCGYRLVNTAKKYYYSDYKNLIETLDNAEDAIEAGKKGQIGTLTSAYAEKIKALTDNGIALPSGVEATIPSAQKSYDSIVAYTSDAIVALNNKALTIADQDANKDTAKQFREVADGLQEALDTAADNVEYITEEQAAGIQSAIQTIEDEVFDNDLTYKEAIKFANELSSNNGFTTVAKVRNLMVAIDAAQELVDTKATMPASDADKAIAAINKALNGGTVNGDDLPSKPTDDGNKAPDTGILSTEDGGASTTVAMVAGVATALTAAGAGVVAYRNARRSSRK